MKNVQANQFYTEMQNVMPTHIEENIFEHFKTTGTGSVCNLCIKRREQKMLLSKIYINLIKACRYYFSRFHSKLSCGLRYFSVALNKILITKYTITLAKQILADQYTMKLNRVGRMLSTQFYNLILLLYHLVPAGALQCK